MWKLRPKGAGTCWESVGGLEAELGWNPCRGTPHERTWPGMCPTSTIPWSQELIFAAPWAAQGLIFSSPGSLPSDLGTPPPGFGRRHPPQWEGEMSFSKPSQLRDLGAPLQCTSDSQTLMGAYFSSPPAHRRLEELEFLCVALMDRIRTSGWNLHRGRFQLHIRQNFLVRTVLKWNSLSSEVVSSPTLEAINLLGIL